MVGFVKGWVKAFGLEQLNNGVGTNTTNTVDWFNGTQACLEWKSNGLGCRAMLESVELITGENI